MVFSIWEVNSRNRCGCWEVSQLQSQGLCSTPAWRGRGWHTWHIWQTWHIWHIWQTWHSWHIWQEGLSAAVWIPPSLHLSGFTDLLSVNAVSLPGGWGSPFALFCFVWVGNTTFHTWSVSCGGLGLFSRILCRLQEAEYSQKGYSHPSAFVALLILSVLQLAWTL